MARLMSRMRGSSGRDAERLASPRDVLTDHDRRATTGARDHRVGEPWTGGVWITSKLATVGLWALIISGPVALVLALAAMSATQPQPAQAPAVQPDVAALTQHTADSRQIAEFAQSFVVSWLSTPRGEEGRLAAYGVDTSGLRLPDAPADVSNAAVASVDEVADDVWTAAIGVNVVWPTQDAAAGTETADDDTAPHRQYFQITIDAADDTLAVQALPAPVPVVAAEPAPRLAYRDRVAPGDEAFDAADGFVRALLAGDGDLTRYLAPNADLVAVTPPPYIAVETHDVRIDRAADPQPDGSTLNVLVTATATTAGGQEIAVQYPLTMIARDGRWEVDEIAPAPQTSAYSSSTESRTS